MTVSISNLNFTWANSSNIFTAIGANVNAASYASESRVLRFRVNSNTVFDVDAAGNMTSKNLVADIITSNSLIIINTFSNLLLNNVITSNVITCNIITSNVLTVNNFIANNITINNTINDVITSNIISTNTFTCNIASANTLTSNIISVNVITSNIISTNTFTCNIASANTLTTKNLKFTSATVASLPSASGVGLGFKAFVTDANQNAFFANVFSGGSNAVPVFSDGTRWKIG